MSHTGLEFFQPTGRLPGGQPGGPTEGPRAGAGGRPDPMPARWIRCADSLGRGGEMEGFGGRREEEREREREEMVRLGGGGEGGRWVGSGER